MMSPTNRRYSPLVAVVLVVGALGLLVILGSPVLPVADRTHTEKAKPEQPTKALPQIAPTAEQPISEFQHFRSKGWDFECERSDDTYAVRAVRANAILEPGAQEFLGSLPSLERLVVESSSLGPGDVHALAERCPSISELHVSGERFDMAGRFRPEAQPMKAAVWPECFKFRHLEHLSVDNLYCSGAEDWAIPEHTELESLEISGNLEGMLPSLLTPCKVRALRLRFWLYTQRLTADDHKALNEHEELESLAILGNPFGRTIQLDLDALSSLSNLRQLTLEDCTIDPQSLQRFPALQTLSLRRCAFVSHDFEALLAHPTLEQLVLWEHRNDLLRVGKLPATVATKLRSITIRSPLFHEIDAFAALPCSFDMDLCGSICYMGDHHSRHLNRFGMAQVATLETLGNLHSVSISPYADSLDEDALVRLANIKTLHRLKVRTLMDGSVPPAGTFEINSPLEEVRFITENPLNQEFVGAFLGPCIRTALLGDHSHGELNASPAVPVTNVQLREFGMFGITLPVPEDSLYGQLMSPSVEDLTLTLCSFKKGATRQLVREMPSLRRLTLDAFSIKDMKDLLHLNKLKHLESINFADADVTPEIALSMKAKRVRFGDWKPED